MPKASDPLRPGERVLSFDPADRADAVLHFIGHVRSPWTQGDCPKSATEARERGGTFALEILPDFRPALTGLAAGDPVAVLTFLADARRDLILQSPMHRSGPTGTFALRSPARPNPVGLTICRIRTLDPEAGLVGLDAIDVFDGTPVIDIKPWIGRVDIPAR